MLGREIAETFVTPPRGLPFREKLRLLVREALTWADRRRELLQALFALKLRGLGLPCPPDGGRRASRGWDAYTPAWRSGCARPGAAAPSWPGATRDEAACVLVGIMHGFFLRWLAASAGDRPRRRLAEQTDRIVDYFLYGIQGGAAHA